jgi:hypothetical protein
VQARTIQQLEAELKREESQREIWQEQYAKLQKEVAIRESDRSKILEQRNEALQELTALKSGQRSDQEDFDLKMQVLGWTPGDLAAAKANFAWLRGNENTTIGATEASARSVQLPVLEVIVERFIQEQPGRKLSVRAALQSVIREARMAAR